MPERTYLTDIDKTLVAGGDGSFSSSAFVMNQLFVQWTFGEQGRDEWEPLEADEMNYVLEGTALYTLDGETYEVNTGDVLYIPAGVERITSGDAKVLKVASGLPWDRVDLAEHQFYNEYRNWPAINK